MLSHFIPSIITTSFDAFGAIGSGGGTGVTETVSLSGTSGAPASFFGPFPQWNGSNWYQNIGFVFKTDGNIYRQQPTTGSGTLFSSVNWNNTTPSTTYYIRFTDDGGIWSPNTGDALNTWHALSSNRSFSYSETTPAFGGYGYTNIRCKVEIASDAAGTNILATGYYRAEWEGGA